MTRAKSHADSIRPANDRGWPSRLARAFVVAWLVATWPVGGSADEGNSAQQEVFELPGPEADGSA